VKDVIDFVSFDAGPFTFCPTAKVDFQDVRIVSATVGTVVATNGFIERVLIQQVLKHMPTTTNN
jgi:hypothetical protein